MDELSKLFINFGFPGAVVAILFYQVISIQKRMENLIDSNTKAMQALKDIIDKCQRIHE